MKNLQEIILEKLKIHKRKAETLSKEQLDMLFLYCMCYLNDEDLCEDAIKDKYISWGEMERYSKFGIDWYDKDHDWITNYGCDNYDKHIDLLNLMDDLAESIIELMDLIIKYSDKTNNEIKPHRYKHNILSEFLFYIMEYIEIHSNSSNIDLTIIDNIKRKINNRTVYYIYDKDMLWRNIIKDKQIITTCQNIYNAALELINK